MKTDLKNYSYYNVCEINNLKELLDLQVKNNPNHPAFSFRKENKIIQKTFQDVYDDVEALSGYFYKNYKNKHIALTGENSYSWIITFLAVILSGNICVVIDKDLNEKEVNQLLLKSDTKISYYSQSYCLFMKDMKIDSHPLEEIEQYIAQGKNIENKNKIDNDKDAVIFFTSGTTGPNKGVVLSQRNMAADIYGASSLYHLDGSVVSFLPYHHAFGLITSVLKPFYYGQEVFISHSLKYIMSDMKQIKPDTIFAVPAFIEMFYKQIWRMAKFNQKDKKLKKSLKWSNRLLKWNIDWRKKIFRPIIQEFGGNLNYIICGGAYLDTKYIEWFRSIGIEILNGYGITECSPVVSVNRNHFFKDGSIGQVCKRVDVKIIEDEICVRGPIVMKGYYKDKKSTNAVMKDGYFHTGDLGFIDEDGFLFITGRKKNLIILSNGENISPEVIESELMQDDAICEVVVISRNNKIIACIYPNEEFLSDQEYFDHLIYKYNKDKPKNHQISMVELRTKEFPKNHNGKIMRNQIEGE